VNAKKEIDKRINEELLKLQLKIERWAKRKKYIDQDMFLGIDASYHLTSKVILNTSPAFKALKVLTIDDLTLSVRARRAINKVMCFAQKITLTEVADINPLEIASLKNVGITTLMEIYQVVIRSHNLRVKFPEQWIRLVGFVKTP